MNQNTNDLTAAVRFFDVKQITSWIEKDSFI